MFAGCNSVRNQRGSARLWVVGSLRLLVVVETAVVEMLGKVNGKAYRTDVPMEISMYFDPPLQGKWKTRFQLEVVGQKMIASFIRLTSWISVLEFFQVEVRLFEFLATKM